MKANDNSNKNAHRAHFLYLLHPIAFALFPILSLISHNIDQVALSEGVNPAIFTLILVFGFWMITSIVLRNAEKASILASLAAVVFFNYGKLQDFLYQKGWHIGEIILGRNMILIPTISLFFYCFSLWLAKRQLSIRSLSQLLTVMGVALILFASFPIAYHEIKLALASDYSQSESNGLDAESNRRQNRDIYYIILDGYASARTLKDRYGYDNSDFLNSLSRKGFFIADKSRSNYAMTHFSLASSLNMEHLTAIRDAQGENSKDISRIWQMVPDNKVVNFLKSHGYKYIHVQSGFGLTDYNKNADINIKVQGARLDRFSMMLIKMSLLRPIAKNFIANDLRDRYIYTFYKLADMPKIKGPKFVFAHLTIPHPPYVFGKNGEPVKDFKDTPATTDVFMYADWKPRERYVDQLAFVNDRIDWVVGEIIRKSTTKPIIIIQADHGPAISPEKKEVSSKRPFDQSRSYIKARTEILNAYYLPGGKDKALYKSITPVNTFRLIFNEYFDTNYGLLDDKTYYSTYTMPFKFVELDENFYIRN